MHERVKEFLQANDNYLSKRLPEARGVCFMINPDPALGVVDLDIGVQRERDGEAYFSPIGIDLNIPVGHA